MKSSTVFRNNYYGASAAQDSNGAGYNSLWNISRVVSYGFTQPHGNPLTGQVFIGDADWNNYHAFTRYAVRNDAGARTTNTAQYVLLEHTGANDAGETGNAFTPAVAASGFSPAFNISNIISLPSADAHTEQIDIVGFDGTDPVIRYDRATVVMGTGYDYGVETGHSPASPANNGSGGVFSSLIWAAGVTNRNVVGFACVGACFTALTTFGPAPDYNAIFPASSSHYGAHKYTGTPGAHDLDGINPLFPQVGRSLVTWPTLYLGIGAGSTVTDYLGSHTVTQWATGTNYAVGDYFIDSDSGTYGAFGGQAVLYRVTVAHTSSSGSRPWNGNTVICSSGSPGPAGWRTKLEYGLFQVIQEAVVSDTKYGNAGMDHHSPQQAGGIRVAQTLYNWIAQQLEPQNRQHCRAGVGGVPTGAAECRLMPAVAVF